MQNAHYPAGTIRLIAATAIICAVAERCRNGLADGNSQLQSLCNWDLHPVLLRVPQTKHQHQENLLQCQEQQFCV